MQRVSIKRRRRQQQCACCPSFHKLSLTYSTQQSCLMRRRRRQSRRSSHCRRCVRLKELAERARNVVIESFSSCHAKAHVCSPICWHWHCALSISLSCCALCLPMWRCAGVGSDAALAFESAASVVNLPKQSYCYVCVYECTSVYLCVGIYMLRHTHALIICKQYAWPKLQLLVSFRFVSRETKTTLQFFVFAAALHFKCIFYGLIFCACLCECVWVCQPQKQQQRHLPACRSVRYFAAFLFLCTFLLRLLMNYAALSLHPTPQLGPVSISCCPPWCVCVSTCVCLFLWRAFAFTHTAPFAHFCCRCRCCHKNRIFIAFQFVIVYHTHTYT